MQGVRAREGPGDEGPSQRQQAAETSAHAPVPVPPRQHVCPVGVGVACLLAPEWTSLAGSPQLLRSIWPGSMHVPWLLLTAGEVKRILGKITRIDQDNYPETLGKTGGWAG